MQKRNLWFEHKGGKKTPMRAQGLQGIEEYPTLEILKTLLDKAQNKPVYI